MKGCKKMSNKTNNSRNKSNMIKLGIIAVSAILILVVAFSINVPGSSSDSNSGGSSIRAKEVKDNDIVIPVSDITETARFYPANINGTKLEVIAVKAPDGSIRTAFNTCQVCYSSGRGYYEQDGDVLVCQNCGNRFSMDQVEITRGGCNPVPITEEYKTTTDDNITVSKDFLTQATVIFQNWKE
jgi:uncharacterized membrane protein